MSALGKFKGLFGEKAKSGTQSKDRPNHLKEVKADSDGQSQKKIEKAELEILQKKIRSKISNDPKLQKKAAMIIESMLNGNKESKDK